MKKLFFLSVILLVMLLVVSALRPFSIAHAVNTAGGASAAFNSSTTASTDAVASANATDASLQQQIDTNNQQIAALNLKIATYQAEIQQAGADKKTLQAAINALDLQRNKIETEVTATQLQINATKLQIQQLGGEIVDTQQTIDTEQAGLADELVILQKLDGRSLLVQTLSSGDLAQIWNDTNATLQMQGAIQNKMQSLQAEKDNLDSSQVASKQKQNALTTQKLTLASQQQSLVVSEQTKTQLLIQTKQQESTYQKLLAEAQAELNSFSAFTQNAGGSKLLGNQTTCDSWGCYYNQRDALWGNEPLNGTKYNLASDGCLISSMAMVMTHYGYRDVTPSTINLNPDNFAAYYPAYLLVTISVDGVSATRKSATIDATLATGNPVIVGLKAYGGTHYVVLVSGSRGNYIMRDPYIANGKDISFSTNYSMRNIFGISKVQINS